MRRRFALPLLVFLSFAVLSVNSGTAGPLTQIIAFGDSLSDTGNAFNLTGGADPAASYGYYQGRFTNGPVWLDNLATKLGVADPTASRTGGTNYAYGGASTGPTPAGAATGAPPGYDPLYIQPPLPNALQVQAFVPTLATQIQTYLQAASGVADPNALYVVWAGTNDLLQGQSDPTIPAANDVAAVNALLNAGARSVLIANNALYGNSPYGQSLGTSGAADLNSRFTGFNAALVTDVAGVRAANPGADISFLDTNALITAIMNNPGDYGFTDTTSDALALILNGQNINPDNYLWWDGVHFTASVNQLIADAAFAAVAVPEPASLSLLGFGVAGIGLWCRRWKRVARSPRP
jgi:cholinesterase